MYSKYDDPNFVPLPGERERDRVGFLEARRARLLREVADLDARIEELKNTPYFLDIPLPI